MIKNPPREQVAILSKSKFDQIPPYSLITSLFKFYSRTPKPPCEHHRSIQFNSSQAQILAWALLDKMSSIIRKQQPILC
jgi:hypothetical protein